MLSVSIAAEIVILQVATLRKRKAGFVARLFRCGDNISER